jgi:hypothetical protein
MTLEQLSWFVDDTVKRELQGLKGVGRVDRYGGVDREIRVALDPDRLMASASPAATSTASSAPPMSTSPAGAARSAARSSRSARWPARSVEELAATKIVLPGGREVRSQGPRHRHRSPRSRELRPARRRAGRRPSQVFRSKGASDVASRRCRRAKIDELRAEKSRHRHHQDRRFGRTTRSATTRRP